MLPWVIGITGHMRAGKDTVAAFLVENYGYTRIGFADGVRDALLALDPPVGADYEALPLSTVVDEKGWEEAKKYTEVRRLLQRMGTEVGRAILGENTWVDVALRKLDHHEATTPGHTRFVIPDVRFPNEAWAIRYYKGQLWRVRRPGYGGDSHDSERFVDEIEVDLELHNTTTLGRLRAQVAMVMERYEEETS